MQLYLGGTQCLTRGFLYNSGTSCQRTFHTKLICSDIYKNRRLTFAPTHTVLGSNLHKRHKGVTILLQQTLKAFATFYKHHYSTVCHHKCQHDVKTHQNDISIRHLIVTQLNNVHSKECINVTQHWPFKNTLVTFLANI